MGTCHSGLQRPTLPEEILEMIGTWLSDDKNTLRQCSLVCKDWLPRSSAHLFRTLCFPNCLWHWSDVDVAIAGTAAAAAHPSCATQKGFCDLLNFIRSSERIRGSVRDLKLTAVRYSPHSGSDDIEGLDPEVLPLHIFFDIANAFPRLTSVTFSQCMPTHDELDPSPRYPEGKLLSVESVALDVEYTDALLYLACFERINTLNIRNFNEIPDTPPLRLPATPGKLKVSTLNLHDGHDCFTLLDESIILVSLPYLIDMESIRAYKTDYSSTPESDTFIKCLRNLESLTLPLDKEPLALAVPEHLHTLKLTHVYHHEQDTSPDALASLVRALKHFAQDTVQELCIALRLTLGARYRSGAHGDDARAQLVGQLDWTSLRRALQAYPSLERLRVEVVCPDNNHPPEPRADSALYVAATREAVEKHVGRVARCPRLPDVAQGRLDDPFVENGWEGFMHMAH